MSQKIAIYVKYSRKIQMNDVSPNVHWLIMHAKNANKLRMHISVYVCRHVRMFYLVASTIAP